MSENKLDFVDSLRFLNSMHTTTRQLTVCTEIIRTLAKSSLPRTLLETKLINWSSQKEKIDYIYNKSAGKITEIGRKTTAIKHYLSFCEEVGLVKSVGSIYSNTRHALILLSLLPTNTRINGLSQAEKLFYSFWLLNKDADGLLLAMAILDENDEISQSNSKKIFLNRINVRLLVKQDHALSIARQRIVEKYRLVNFIWKNAESYAEHIVIPRYEWLSQLGLVSINKKSNSTNYSLTDLGKEFYRSIPTLESIKDINEDWIADHFFSNLESKCINKHGLRSFADKEKADLIAKVVSSAIDNVRTSTSFKSPLFDTVVYSCFIAYLDKNICVDIREVIRLLRTGISDGHRHFRIKESARLNEGYLLY